MTAKRVAVEILFLFHAAFFALVVFGWLVPRLFPLYVSALVTTLISDWYFGCCILSKWEFDLRKAIAPHIDYDYNFATYYTYKLTNRRVSNVFFCRASITFLIASLALALFFRFFTV